VSGEFVRLLVVVVPRSEARSEVCSEGLEPPTFRSVVRCETNAGRMPDQTRH
jgi:hypothetical protein